MKITCSVMYAMNSSIEISDDEADAARSGDEETIKVIVTRLKEQAQEYNEDIPISFVNGTIADCDLEELDGL